MEFTHSKKRYPVMSSVWNSHVMRMTKKGNAKNVVGSQIRKIRTASQPAISQEDLSGRLAARGITLDRSAISRIENQDRYLMDYEILAIAKCLKVSVASLFGE